MKNLMKIELKRAFFNPLFLLSLAIGCGISIWELYERILRYDILSPDAYASAVGSVPPSLFNSALGFDMFSVSSVVFYYVLPILAVIPFADSFFTDLKSGYIKNVFTRTEKASYYTAKYVAVFLSAAIVIAIPLLLNLFLAAAFRPAVVPEPNSNAFTYCTIVFSGIYFTHPFVFAFLYTLIDSLFAGLFACIAVSVSFFVTNRFIVLVSPFVVYITIHSAAGLISSYFDVLCFLMFLQPGKTNFLSIFICGLILFAIPLGIYIYRGRKDETF